MSRVVKATFVAAICLVLSSCDPGLIRSMYGTDMHTWIGRNWHEFDRAERMDCHPTVPGRIECIGMTLYITRKGAIAGWNWHPGINL